MVDWTHWTCIAFFVLNDPISRVLDWLETIGSRDRLL